MTVILDPTDERVPLRRNLAKRPEMITGTVALLDISKPRGNILLDQLEFKLLEQLPDIKIKRYIKPTFTKPAPPELRKTIAAEADFVIEGLAD